MVPGSFTMRIVCFTIPFPPSFEELSFRHILTGGSQLKIIYLYRDTHSSPLITWRWSWPWKCVSSIGSFSPNYCLSLVKTMVFSSLYFPLFLHLLLSSSFPFPHSKLSCERGFIYYYYHGTFISDQQLTKNQPWCILRYWTEQLWHHGNAILTIWLDFHFPIPPPKNIFLW